MKTSGTNRKIRVLMTALRDEKLVPRPDFQRRLVWTNRHKEYFLQTVLDDYPFPEIYVASGNVDTETGEGDEMLVDGQQRITTLYQYFTGSPDLQCRNIPPYSELSEKQKINFLEYDVVVRDLGSKPKDEIIEVFERINSTSYSLNAMEVHNARFDGELKQFAEKLAGHKFFSANSVFPPNDIRRMNDLVFCLSIVISVLTGYFNRNDLLEDFLYKYNDRFTKAEELAERFSNVFGTIDACKFAAKSRVWRKADLFSLIVEVYIATHLKNATMYPDILAPMLTKFYETVEAVRDNDAEDEVAATYYKAALQATNDRSSRLRRGKIIAGILAASAVKHHQDG